MPKLLTLPSLLNAPMRIFQSYYQDRFFLTHVVSTDIIPVAFGSPVRMRMSRSQMTLVLSTQRQTPSHERTLLLLPSSHVWRYVIGQELISPGSQPMNFRQPPVNYVVLERASRLSALRPSPLSPTSPVSPLFPFPSTLSGFPGPPKHRPGEGPPPVDVLPPLTYPHGRIEFAFNRSCFALARQAYETPKTPLPTIKNLREYMVVDRHSFRWRRKPQQYIQICAKSCAVCADTNFVAW